MDNWNGDCMHVWLDYCISQQHRKASDERNREPPYKVKTYIHVYIIHTATYTASGQISQLLVDIYENVGQTTGQKLGNTFYTKVQKYRGKYHFSRGHTQSSFTWFEEINTNLDYFYIPYLTHKFNTISKKIQLNCNIQQCWPVKLHKIDR